MAILGTAGGWIERFNLQSGISRGSYLDVSERGSHAHEGEVVGVACDSTNTLMISAGYHGDVKVSVPYYYANSFILYLAFEIITYVISSLVYSCCCTLCHVVACLLFVNVL